MRVSVMADVAVGYVTQDAHLQTVVEVLQSIKASEMTPMLQRIYGSDGGSELLDVLMKYLWVHAPVLHVTDIVAGADDVAAGTRAWRRRPKSALPRHPPE